MDRIELARAFARIDEPWRPKVVAELNGQEVKLVKVHGTFVWHRHEAADELFLVWGGRMRLELEGRALELGPGELAVVPRGVLHRTSSEAGAEVLVFEPAETRNTGDVLDARFTAPQGARLDPPATA